MASFVLSFFPLDVLDEIWDLIESVSEGFLTYFFLLQMTKNGSNFGFAKGFVTFKYIFQITFSDDTFMS